MKYDNVTIRKAMRLYLVSDRHWLANRTLYDDIQEALNGGVTCVQIREKELDCQSFIHEATQLQRLCRTYHVPCIINDNIDVMLAIDADGIHVGQHDMAVNHVRARIGNEKILGVSVQSVEQALLAQSQGADYLGVGAMFSTNTKKDADDVTYAMLKAICEAVQIPAVAIGGITCDNMHELRGSGIDGVALVSAIMAQPDIKQACEQLLERTGELLS